ncbi:hypothetical protein Leryth_016383 [Lithospermum erythrorhizon]|nr:hypothetical protein Leryth_016383 [Lithospermum erythrorhizon]
MPMIDQEYPEYRHYKDIKELSPHRLTEIRRFFEDYKKNENKEVATNDFLPSQTAVDVVQNSIFYEDLLN